MFISDLQMEIFQDRLLLNGAFIIFDVTQSIALQFVQNL